MLHSELPNEGAKPPQSTASSDSITEQLRKISHNLNNQLATMRMTVELMQRKELDQTNLKMLSNLEQSVINAINEVRKLDAVKMETDK